MTSLNNMLRFYLEMGVIMPQENRLKHVQSVKLFVYHHFVKTSIQANF